MSLTQFVGSVVAVGVMTVGASPSASPAPGEIIIGSIAGVRPVDGPAGDLDADGLSALRPEAIAHLEPDAAARAGLTAAVRSWSIDGVDVVVEVLRIPDEDAAKAVVDQSAAIAVGRGLAATDPPFAGAWAYSGRSSGRTVSITSWSQGSYAVTFTVEDDSDRPIASAPTGTGRAVLDAMIVQVTAILDTTGFAVAEDATVDEEAPVPPTPSDVPTDVDGASVGGVDDGPSPALLLVGAAALVAGGFAIARRTAR